MGWIEKHQLTALEQTELPIHGLFFLDGDVLARLYPRTQTEGMKFAMLAFPSGGEYVVWEGKGDEPIVHLFGEMDLPLRTTRDDAFLLANNIAEACGYAVRGRKDKYLDVWGEDEAERLTLTFYNAQQLLVNVTLLSEDVETPIHPGLRLMSDALRAQLPPL